MTNKTGYPSIDKPWMQYYRHVTDYNVPDGNLYEYLFEKTQKCLKKTALHYKGIKISYQQLFKNIDEIAQQLLSIGVQKGEIVSVCLPNIPEVVYLILAINKIGAVGNMLDLRSGEEVLVKQLYESKSRILFSLDLVLEKFSQILQRTDVEKAVAVSAIESLPGFIQILAKMRDNSLRIEIPDGWIQWSEFKKETNRFEGNLKKVMPNGDAFIAYTGGTTGAPKGVIGTNRNLLAITSSAMVMDFSQGEGDTLLDIAPPWTYYGLLNSLYEPLCLKCAVILVPKLGADELGKVVIKEKPNHVITVPSALTSIMNDNCMKGKDLSFLHSIVVGADKMDESAEVEFNKFLQEHNGKMRLHKGYGMTECMAAACIVQRCSEGVGSVGIPYYCNVIAAFSAENGKYIEQRYGEIGEIAICGPAIMRGYFGNNAEETDKLVKRHDDGNIWLHTGDIGYVDEKGRIYVIGRIKRMFTCNGYKIFPAIIEKSIMTVQEVSAAAVIAIPDVEKGNVIKAYIVASRTDEEIISTVKRTVKSQLYEYECPDIYEFIEKMPLTGMGKVNYTELERMALYTASSG